MDKIQFDIASNIWSSFHDGFFFFFIKNGFDTFWLYLPKKKRQKRFNQYLGPSRAHKMSGNLLETTFPLTFFFSVYITMTCYHHIIGLICIIITEINRKLSTPCFMKCFVLFVFVLFGFVFFITSFLKNISRFAFILKFVSSWKWLRNLSLPRFVFITSNVLLKVIYVLCEGANCFDKKVFFKNFS